MAKNGAKKAMRHAKKQQQLAMDATKTTSNAASQLKEQLEKYEEGRTFHLFSQLPSELRTKIWEHAANVPRDLVFSLATDHTPTIKHESSSKAYQFKPQTPAPSMLSATYESRQIALSHLKLTDPMAPCALRGKAAHMAVVSADQPKDVHFAPFFANPDIDTFTFVGTAGLDLEESVVLMCIFAGNLGLARYEVDLRNVLKVANLVKTRFESNLPVTCEDIWEQAS